MRNERRCREERENVILVETTKVALYLCCIHQLRLTLIYIGMYVVVMRKKL